MCPHNRRRTINTAIARAARATVVVATGAALLTAGLAACGTVKELTAAEKVSSAFDKLGQSKDLSLKLSLDTTPDQLFAYVKSHDGTMQRKDADAIAGLGISAEFHADQPLKDLKSFKAGSDPKDPQVAAEMAKLSVDYKLTDRSGAALVEIRQLHNVLYVHGDINGLAKLSGEDPAQLRDSLEAVIGKQGPLHDALSGGWASLDQQTLTDFAADAAKGGDEGDGEADGAGAPAPSAKPSLDPKTRSDLLNSLKSVLSSDLSFASKGTVDGADQVQATVPFRKLLEDLFQAVKPLSGKLLPQKEAGKLPDHVPNSVPDKNVTADLSIKNGALVGVRFDLAQLDDKAAADTHLPLKVAIDPNAPAIQAPAQAGKVTQQDLGRVFTGLMGSIADRAGGGKLTPPGFPKSPAAELTPAQVTELATKTGRTPQQITGLNSLGLGYDDILAMGRGDGQSQV